MGFRQLVLSFYDQYFAMEITGVSALLTDQEFLEVILRRVYLYFFEIYTAISPSLCTLSLPLFHTIVVCQHRLIKLLQLQETLTQASRAKTTQVTN